MSKIVKPIIELLDHTHLGMIIEGEIVGLWTRRELPDDFYPTSENLLFWIAGRLKGLDIHQIHQTGEVLTLKSWWSQLELNETCTCAAILTREEFDNVGTGKS